MTTVFIAGSMNIRRLDPMVQERVDKIVSSGFDIVVGDADGADASIQEHLFKRGAAKATVFCSGQKPRNNVGAWPVHAVETEHEPGSRAFFTAKDLLMAQIADFGLMVWDAKSTGTLSNVIELLSRDKKCVVFVNRKKLFKTVCDIGQLQELLRYMSDHAKQKAEDKIRLFEKLEALKHRQRQMFAVESSENHAPRTTERNWREPNRNSRDAAAVSVETLTKEELTRVLAYSGLILVAFELVKSLIVRPIKAFYSNVTFGDGMPFKSYEHDVLSRHRNEFEACLLYLRDFMQAIDADDMQAIQALREHRNTLAHDLANRLHELSIDDYAPVLERANKALFKLSNYRTYMEIGADPKFRGLGIDWNTIKGHEYLLFERVIDRIRLLERDVSKGTGPSSVG